MEDEHIELMLHQRNNLYLSNCTLKNMKYNKHLILKKTGAAFMSHTHGLCKRLTSSVTNFHDWAFLISTSNTRGLVCVHEEMKQTTQNFPAREKKCRFTVKKKRFAVWKKKKEQIDG